MASGRPRALPLAAIVGGDYLVFRKWHFRCYITNPLQQSVRPGAATSPLAKPTSPSIGLICTKCGITNKTGRHSCCARGGAWFKNCGDADDTQFDHTWIQGMQACKSKLWSVRILCRLLQCASCHSNWLLLAAHHTQHFENYPYKQ